MRGTITRDAGSGQVRTFQVQGSRDGARDASEIHSTDAELLGATETRTIGDSAYQRLPGVEQWIQLDRDPAVGAQPDLTNPFSLLNQLRDIAGIEPLGTGTIDGVTVTHYRVTIDMEALMKRVPPKYREEPSSTSRVFDVWVDERSRVRRFKGTETTPQVTWRYDLEFYDFGADIHMQAPSGSEVVGGGAAAVPTSEFPETSPGASADPATWTVAPGARITGAARTLNVLVRRFACNDGVTGRVAAPAIRYGANEIEVTFTVDTRSGFHTCQGNDEVPYLVHLQEPIGSRTLVDGTCRNVPDAIGSSYCASGPTRWPDPGR
jgi:hypothetical protein